MNLRILLILGALSAFGPLAIDFYLPSFPTLAKAFATDVEHVQLSLAAYFAGLSIGQLLYGPVADRYGRRLPLLVGVSIFTLASAACALAPSLEWLIAARFVQALGGCAGMVISRAVVRDLNLEDLHGIASCWSSMGRFSTLTWCQGQSSKYPVTDKASRTGKGGVKRLKPYKAHG